MDLKRIIENTKYEEGYKQHPYLDTVNKMTIGYGFNLDDVGLSKDECDVILEMRIQENISFLKSRLYSYDIKDEAFEILVEMSYQIGAAGLMKFKNMLSALKEQDYEKASVEMLSSRWAVQTPNRAKRLADRMRALG